MNFNFNSKRNIFIALLASGFLFFLVKRSHDNKKYEKVLKALNEFSKELYPFYKRIENMIQDLAKKGSGQEADKAKYLSEYLVSESRRNHHFDKFFIR